MFYLRCLAPLIVLASMVPVQAADGDDALRTSLYEKWTAQADDIVTGTFDVGVFEYHAGKATQVDRDQFEKLLTGLKDFSEGSMKGLRDSPRLIEGRFELWPKKAKISIDGKSVANDNLETGFKFVDHNGIQIISTADKQVELYGADGYEIGMLRLPNLRYTPYLFPDRKADQITLLGQVNGMVSYQIALEDGKADSKTGFVYWWSSKKHPTNTFMERYQFSPKKMAGGILIPGATVEAIFDSGKLIRFHLLVLVKIALNEEIDTNRFVVPVPAGGRVVDLRTDATNPSVSQCSKAYPDAVQVADRTALSAKGRKPLPLEQKDEMAPSSVSRGSRFLPWILGTAAVTACIGVLLLIMRAKSAGV